MNETGASDMDAVAGSDERGSPATSVLVVVVNEPVDLDRARDERWYRIPLARAPRRIAAEFLAFYQTGAFPPDERWGVRWLAPVRGYQVASRSELIPSEPDHPRAADLYYRINLGPLQPLPRPVPSRRLRRVTFIPTTLDRLLAAAEINDLWVKSSAQERLWEALSELRVEAERQLPLDDEWPARIADFALPGPPPVALVVADEPPDEEESHSVAETAAWGYAWACPPWQILRATRAELDADPIGWALRLIGGGAEQ